LLNDYSFYLDLGGIANLSYKTAENIIAFEVCAATRVLNMLGADKNEAIAAKGKLYTPLLTRLNAFPYYSLPHPKSLTDNLETKEIYRVIEAFDISNADKLRTYTEHIATQIRYAIQKLAVHNDVTRTRLLVTGGGAFNSFLIQRLIVALQPLNIEVIVPDAMLIRYKEALIMALIGVLRWREEYNVLNTVTGATRNSIGGSVWIGQEA
jgi:anhydro-N-acetylmuramic acid kinase